MLVLVRHGESTANEQNIKAGQLNVPLTERGIQQAKALRGDIGSYQYDAVFLSDAERCQDTTWHAIGHRHPRETWTLAEELRERSGGIYEGMPYPEIRKLLPPKKYKLWQRDYFEAPMQGESMKDVEDRVVPFMQEYVFPLINAGKHVWVCSHHVTIQVIIGHIKGMEETMVPSLKIEHAVPYVLYGTVQM